MMKQNIKRMLPVLIIIGVTIGMSIFLYNQVLDREEKKCWQLLSDSAQSVSKEIEEKFKGNVAILRVAARTISEENKTSPSQVQSLHLSTYRKDTIFTRMEIIYPEDQIVTEDGTTEKSRKGITFQNISKKGEHISHRMKDVQTGNESVYYYVPIKKKGKTIAVLTGVIDAEKLSKEIKPTIYNGHAVCLVVDSTDGNYIVDNWHKTLENAYKTPHRKRLKKYENINLKDEIKQQKTGIIAFKSRTNGLDTYMYYQSIGFFDWELLVMTQETVVFENHAYRVGGDEFVVVEKEIGEKQFQEKVASLRNQLKERNISSAVGVIWEEECNDLEDSVHKADEKMYEEKERGRNRV